MSGVRVSISIAFAVVIGVGFMVFANVAGAKISESNVEYSNPNGQHLKLDLRAPEGEGPFPAVVCIHGGGFRAGDQSHYDATCDTLAEHGYVAVTINYRLAPTYQFPAAVEDSKAAVRWLRANAEKYHIDPKRVGAMGGSAGGTLALFLGVTGDQRKYDSDGGNLALPSRVQCVVSYFGASDFTKSYGKSVDAAEVLPLYLGGNLEEARERHVEASPLNYVTKDDAPTLCLHGTKDQYVAVEQSEWMVDRLTKAGVEAKLIKFEGARHGFERDVQAKADEEMIQFFDVHLKAGGEEGSVKK